MARDIPFQWITGLEHQAQYEIWRDFLDVLEQITPGSSSPFDAVIDGSLAASDPGSHQYINLAELVAGETGWTSTKLFAIGVRASTSATITEPARAHTTPPGPFSMWAFGHTGPLYEDLGGIPAFTRWDLNGGDVTVAIATLHNIEMTNTNTSFASAGIIGSVYFDACRVNCVEGASAGLQPSTLYCVANDTMFVSPTFAFSVFAFNCHWFQTVSVNATVCPANREFVWDGGSFSWSASGSPTLTFNCAKVVFHAAVQTRLGEAASGAGINIATTGNVAIMDFDFYGSSSGNGVNLNCAATTGVNATIRGDAYWGLTFSGGGGTLDNVTIDIVMASSAAIDITGPARVAIAGFMMLSTTTNQLILRGSGIRADINTIVNPNTGKTYMQLIGLKDSLITAAIDGGTLSNGQMYSFDATSARNILIVAGLHTAFATTSTDAGTQNRVITEISDTVVTSIVNAIIASVGVGTGPPGPPGEDGADGMDGAPGPVNEQPWRTAWGPLAPAAQATSNQGSITGAVDITGVTVTVRPQPNRYIRVTITGVTVASTAGTVSGWESALLKDGSTVAIRTGGGFNLPATSASLPDITFIDTPTGASHTYKLQCLVTAGGGTMTTVASASFPIQILTEDAGPVA